MINSQFLNPRSASVEQVFGAGKGRISISKLAKLALLFLAVFFLAVSCNILTRPQSNQAVDIPSSTASRSFTYEGIEGESAVSLLKQLYRVETKDYGPSLGEMVTSIEGIKPAADEFWAFYVNGQSSTVGASSYTTKDSDRIEWKLEKIQP